MEKISHIISTVIFLCLMRLSVQQALTFDELHPSAQDNLCGLTDYDTQTIAKPNWPLSWEFTTEAFCLQNMNISQNCNFQFSFCAPLPQYTGSGSACDGASVCQMDSIGSTRAFPKNLGKWMDLQPQFVASTFNLMRPVGFFAAFTNGESLNVTGNTDKVATVIFFECDKRYPWIPINGTASVPGPVNVTWDDSKHNYWIYVKYSGACLSITPSGGNVINPVIALSAGTILLIVFFSILAIYFGGGCITNAVRGKQGSEVIPNSTLWTNLPGYTKDGVMFVINCGSVKKESTFKPQSGYDSI